MNCAHHIALAKHNEAFVNSFGDYEKNTTPFLDWIVIATYYAALHYVDAVLYLSRGKDPHSHEERREAIRSEAKLAPVKNSYKFLEDKSKKARYLGWTFTPAEVKKLQLRYLEPIREVAVKHCR
jgi:uncharacterized protein (UPF0332 family)